MDFDDYTSLKAAVEGWIDRDDAETVAAIPAMIRLAEVQMQRRLDCREMQSVITVTVDDERVTVPDDFAGVKSFRLQTTPTQALKGEKPDYMDDDHGTGAPDRYAVAGSEFLFSPVPDGTYTARLRYRTRIEPLSASNPTNWVLENHPDLYLYGALMHSAPYLKDDARVVVWAQQFTAGIDDVNGEGDRLVHAPAARAKRIG